MKRSAQQLFVMRRPTVYGKNRSELEK